MSEPAEFDYRSGEGVRGTVNRHRIDVGNRKLLEEEGGEPAEWRERAETLRGEGQTTMFVVVDGKLAGLFGVADPVKETTPEALAMLRAEGLRKLKL